MGRNVFTIPPGVPFLSTFVEALLAGEIVSNVSRASAPIDLARMTIYVPTQRAARALAAEFARAIKAPAALLPRILPLGSLEEQEDIALFSGYAEEFDERFLARDRRDRTPFDSRATDFEMGARLGTRDRFI